MIHLATGAALTAAIAFVCWWFRPPQVTPVSEECRKHYVRAAMRRGDDPNDASDGN